MIVANSEPTKSIAEVVTRLNGMTSPDIVIGDGLETAAKKILLFQLSQMLFWQPIALAGEDIEGVHKMRVSTRRMRTMFRYLKPYFKKKAFRPHRLFIPQVGRTLGKVRDMDVIRLVLVQQELTGFPDWNTAYETRYDNARKQLLEFVHSDQYQQRVVDLFVFLTDEQWKLKKHFAPVYLDDLKQYFPGMLFGQWRQIREDYHGITPAPYCRLHRLRIDLKRLRYLVEFFIEVLTPVRAQDAILEIIQLQDHLGNLNDVYNTVQLMDGMMAEHPDLSSRLSEKQQVLIAIQEKSAKDFISVWPDFQSGRINHLLESLLP